MRIFRPTYTGAFECDGKACNSRCCRDWRVSADEETRDKYSRLPDADRQNFFKHLDDSAQAFKLQPSGACPFLDENFLCKLQLKHGEDYLPAICQSYPRVTYRLGAEIYLQAMTLTCPVAAMLILLRGEPITFEVVGELKARQIFDFTTKIPLPAEEFLARQSSAVKILQRRDLPINGRLAELCAFFGEEVGADFDEAAHASALAEIFGQMYSVDINADKKAQLAETYRFGRKEVLPQMRVKFATVLENYLVNEFVMRCYPCAFAGDELFNCRVFVTVYRAIEFAAVLTAISKARLTLADFMDMLCALNDKLDHSKGGMDAIKTCAANAGENFCSMMIERGGSYEGNS